MSKEKFLRDVSTMVTCRLSMKDIDDLRWYRYSSKRIVVRVRDTLLPDAVFSNNEEVLTYLKELGIKEMKKPKPYRSTPPLYD